MPRNEGETNGLICFLSSYSKETAIKKAAVTVEFRRPLTLRVSPETKEIQETKE